MFNKDFDEVVKQLNSDKEKGLSTKEVQERLEKYGNNELKGKKKQSLFVKFLLQFKDLMIIILILRF